MGFTNTKELSELAHEFNKYGHYPYQDEWLRLKEKLNEGRGNKSELIPTYEMMSYEAQKFADYWIDRFVNGAVIGGVPYTGEHLFYLNCVRIEQVKYKKGSKIGRRTVDFPSFWDEDYKYFVTCDIARWGIGEPGNRVEAYEKLCSVSMDLGLIPTEENLAGGLNHLWLKPRGVGASWKGGAWNAYNLYLLPNTQNFIFADNTNYLADKDGIFMKFVKIRDFIQDNCWFLRKHFYKQSLTDRNYSTGLTQTKGGSSTTEGFNSTVVGVVTDGNPDIARGKRGNATFEEFGSFPKVAEIWQKYHASVNEYGVVYGQMRGFGTGGDAKGDYKDLEMMWRDPDTYHIIQFKNIYESQGTKGAMFTPAYRNITDKDENGNSLEDVAKEKLDKAREVAKNSPNPAAFTIFCGEFPYEPNEAFNSSGTNILPVDLAKAALNRLKITNLDRKICAYGKLEFNPNGKGVQFVPTNARPYEAYPVEPKHDKTSCVVILQQPYRDSTGKVPENLYRICCDPYSQAESSESQSVGDIRVIENINGLTKTKGDIIVAWYRGRPEGHNGQYIFCDILYKLAEFYNAKIAIENDQPGEVISHAKRFRDSQGRRLTRYLEEQFELNMVINGVNVATKKGMNRVFGMNMTPVRKEEGTKLYQEWLLRPRGQIEEENGEVRMLRNIDFIYCRAMLEEIISGHGRNADSISSMIVGMYHEKELVFKNRRVERQKRIDNFFNSPLF